MHRRVICNIACIITITFNPVLTQFLSLIHFEKSDSFSEPLPLSGPYTSDHFTSKIVTSRPDTGDEGAQRVLKLFNSQGALGNLLNISSFAIHKTLLTATVCCYSVLSCGVLCAKPKQPFTL